MHDTIYNFAVLQLSLGVMVTDRQREREKRKSDRGRKRGKLVRRHAHSWRIRESFEW